MDLFHIARHLVRRCLSGALLPAGGGARGLQFIPAWRLLLRQRRIPASTAGTRMLFSFKETPLMAHALWLRSIVRYYTDNSTNPNIHWWMNITTFAILNCTRPSSADFLLANFPLIPCSCAILKRASPFVFTEAICHVLLLTHAALRRGGGKCYHLPDFCDNSWTVQANNTKLAARFSALILNMLLKFWRNPSENLAKSVRKKMTVL